MKLSSSRVPSAVPRSILGEVSSMQMHPILFFASLLQFASRLRRHVLATFARKKPSIQAKHLLHQKSVCASPLVNYLPHHPSESDATTPSRAGTPAPRRRPTPRSDAARRFASHGRNLDVSLHIPRRASRARKKNLPLSPSPSSTPSHSPRSRSPRTRTPIWRTPPPP